MSFGGFDQEILQDFITECGELLESLEGDLMALEATPGDLDLLNTVFRALHTIKGSASFLALTHLVSVAHAAETALNAARNERLVVDRQVMDLLLEAVDLVKVHFHEIEAGEELTEPEARLVDALTLLGEGGTPETDPSAETDTSPAAEAVEASEPAGPLGASIATLELDSGKANLLEFLIADAEESIAAVAKHAERLADAEMRAEAVHDIIEVLDALRRTVDFFEFESMLRLTDSLRSAATAIEQDETRHVDWITPCFDAVVHLLTLQVEGLQKNELYDWSTEPLLAAMDTAIHASDAAELVATPGEAAESLLARLKISASAAAAVAEDSAPVNPIASIEPAQADSPIASDDTAQAGSSPAQSLAAPGPSAPAADTVPNATPSAAPTAAQAKAKATVEQTIRVEVGRLESLMNLVGELVLQKNRLSALTRQVGAQPVVAQETRESILQAAGDLDRVTGDIQTAVMRTRMQPLDKLFGKYPRLIRDLAKKTGKQIDLVIEGGDTEVDKSVLEELGDPLVHLMRNSADHGLEPPEERAAAGKEATGRITLAASNEGGSVSVRIIDDGRGLTRERIAKKALEKGLTTEMELAQLSDRDVYRFIFHAGFSTVEKVSDLSGRGVGMDVVRTNIERLKGTVDVDSTPGHGTVITVRIPLTVAILPAMMVRVAEEIYAIPLGSILEIVRPQDRQLSTVQERPVMRLRDVVLPLIDAREAFDTPDPEQYETPFAVVLSINEKRVGLMVSGLIGQQEIVIKPLETANGEEPSGPFGGTTVRDDGGVSLIVDVAELMRQSEGTRPGLRPALAAA
ncbi:MAG: chemotaxis protein CheA [Planctomycetota bacterium]